VEQRVEPLPAPAYAPPRTEEPIVYAAWGQRFGAWFLDGAITAFIAVLAVVGILAATGAHRAVFEGLETPTESDDDAFFGAYLGWLLAWGLLGGVYHTVLHGWRGQTAGKMMLGIRVRNDSGDEPIGYGRAFARWIMPAIFWTFFWIPGMLDVLWPLWDRKKQSFHDKIARSLVVRG